jgi:hypothetical protein
MLDHKGLHDLAMRRTDQYERVCVVKQVICSACVGHGGLSLPMSQLCYTIIFLKITGAEQLLWSLMHG